MIFFDLDGTLLDHECAAAAAEHNLWLRHKDILCVDEESLRIQWNNIIDKYMKASRAWSFLEVGPLSLRELLGPAHADRSSPLNIETEFSLYLKDYENSCLLFDDGIGCLDRLNFSPIGLITNGDSSIQRVKLERLLISERFQPIVISTEVGNAKPDPAIFSTACELAECSPSECIFVGDNIEQDVLASQRAGMLPIWLNRKKLDSELPGINIIHSLEELPDLLSREFRYSPKKVSLR
jgi:putative hydrolase of the HAD superfamily